MPRIGIPLVAARPLWMEHRRNLNSTNFPTIPRCCGWRATSTNTFNFDACDISRRFLMLFGCIRLYVCTYTVPPLTTKANKSFHDFPFAWDVNRGRLQWTPSFSVCYLVYMFVCALRAYRLCSINICFCIIKEIPHSHWLSSSLHVARYVDL